MEKISKKVSVLIISSIIIVTKMFLLIPKGSCRFHPSCSEYAREAIQTMPLFEAVIAIAKRLLKCTPFSHGGYDPVQKQMERPDFCE
jgi:uncharacterized protein